MAKRSEPYKLMDKSEKAIEKRIKKQLKRPADIEMLEDVIIQLKEKIVSLEAKLAKKETKKSKTLNTDEVPF